MENIPSRTFPIATRRATRTLKPRRTFSPDISTRNSRAKAAAKSPTDTSTRNSHAKEAAKLPTVSEAPIDVVLPTDIPMPSAKTTAKRDASTSKPSGTPGKITLDTSSAESSIPDAQKPSTSSNSASQADLPNTDGRVYATELYEGAIFKDHLAFESVSEAYQNKYKLQLSVGSSTRFRGYAAEILEKYPYKMVSYKCSHLKEDSGKECYQKCSNHMRLNYQHETQDYKLTVFSTEHELVPEEIKKNRKRVMPKVLVPVDPHSEAGPAKRARRLESSVRKQRAPLATLNNNTMSSMPHFGADPPKLVRRSETLPPTPPIASMATCDNTTSISSGAGPSTRARHSEANLPTQSASPAALENTMPADVNAGVLQSGFQPQMDLAAILNNFLTQQRENSQRKEKLQKLHSMLEIIRNVPREDMRRMQLTTAVWNTLPRNE